MIGFKGRGQRAESREQRAESGGQRAKSKGQRVGGCFSVLSEVLLFTTLHVSSGCILRAKITGYITPRLSDAQSGGIGYLQSGIGFIVFYIIFCISLMKRYKK
ncbi:MAG: hypothetical protein MUO68_02870 [Desulfobacteraceae bacterium]|nr:hypothetical protein [Desulfobacteraceae bacterium]